MWPFMATPERGARTSIFAASSPELTDVTGAYLKRQRRIDTGSKTNDQATAERLWQVSENLVSGTSSK
jgi:hypothetical protein